MRPQNVSAQRRSTFFHPRLEQLEDRTLLATQLYRVPGPVNVSSILRFDWTSRSAGFNNEVGVFQVENGGGRVGGVLPGDPRYLRAVMNSPTRQVLFDSSTGAGNHRTLSYPGGASLAYYTVQNMTSSTLLHVNPTNNPNLGPVAFFSVSNANGDGMDHVHRSDAGGVALFSWEDLLGGGDRDYNDVVFSVKRMGTGEVFSTFRGRAIATPGRRDQIVSTSFNLFGRQTSASNELGVFQVDDATGRIGTLKPGDSGYAAAALAPSRRKVVFNLHQKAGARNALDLPGGSFFGTYLVRNGSADDALLGRATPFFSFLNANGDDFDHVRQYYDSSFGFEDGKAGGDGDFNDALVRVGFGTARSALDTTPPTITAKLRNDTGSSNTDGITTDPTIVGSVTDPSGVRSFRAGFDNTAPANFRDITNRLQSDGSFTLDITALSQIFGGNLTQGSHVLHLQATDNVGNVSQVFDVAFTFDQTAPPLAFDLSPDTDTDPDGDHVTQFDTVTLQGQTTAGLTVTLVQGNRTAVADQNGNFQFQNVPLASGSNDFTMTVTDAAGNQQIARQVITRNDAPTVTNAIGTQNITTAGGPVMFDLTGRFADANIVNSIARFNTELGEFDVGLFDVTTDGAVGRSAAAGGGGPRTTPITVDNFLAYLDANKYQNTIISRASTTFVIQGGGFTVNPPAVPQHITTLNNGIQNEPGNSNLRGTIALARVGGQPNSGSSEWFVNTGNNPSLDDAATRDGGFTAFGQVLGSGMNVVDAIANVPARAVNSGGFQSDSLPLQNYPTNAVYPAGTTLDNYVLTNNVTVWQRRDGLSFTVLTNTDPTVATAAIDANGQLTITPLMPGFTDITIQAKDTHNATISFTFRVNVT